MSTKIHVLKILEENKGCTISGEEIANQLQISRAAIWKAIQELRKEGYTINAITNKGYCLSLGNNVLSVQGILPYLNCQNSVDRIHVYKTLESTNLTAKKMALDGAVPGTVVIAETQTKGRGRMGRSFFSPADSGIYMSMILRPSVNLAKSVLITTAASVAVCKSIEKVTGISCQIKWVNDIYMNDKKVCGILTEAVTDFETGHIEYIILGIGINFNTAKADFPNELANKAGSLFQEASIKTTTTTKGLHPDMISRNQLIAEIINHVLEMNETLESRDFLADYKGRSLVLGKEIRIIQSGASEVDHNHDMAPEATAIDIDSDGGLVVQYKDGTIATLNSGEISIRVK